MKAKHLNILSIYHKIRKKVTYTMIDRTFYIEFTNNEKFFSIKTVSLLDSED